MISPRLYDDVSSAEWIEIHALLKRALAQEIADAAHLGEQLKGPAWWVDVSHRACVKCRMRLLRCRIKGHSYSPFYACLSCGYLQTWWDLTAEAPPEPQDEEEIISTS